MITKTKAAGIAGSSATIAASVAGIVGSGLVPPPAIPYVTAVGAVLALITQIFHLFS